MDLVAFGGANEEEKLKKINENSKILNNSLYKIKDHEGIIKATTDIPKSINNNCKGKRIILISAICDKVYKLEKRKIV